MITLRGFTRIDYTRASLCPIFSAAAAPKIRDKEERFILSFMFNFCLRREPFGDKDWLEMKYS